MADVIKITRRFTADTVMTIVKMPGAAPISKQWKRNSTGFIGKFEKDWDEEPSIPSSVAEAAMDWHSRVCAEMKR